MSKVSAVLTPIELARALESEGFEISESDPANLALRVPSWPACEDVAFDSPWGRAMRDFFGERLTLRNSSTGDQAWIPYWTPWRALQHAGALALCLPAFLGQDENSFADLLSFVLLAQALVIGSYFFVLLRTRSRIEKVRLRLAAVSHLTHRSVD